MADKKRTGAASAILVVSFALLVVSMGLEGRGALLLNGIAILGFVVALGMQLLPRSHDPQD